MQPIDNGVEQGVAQSPESGMLAPPSVAPPAVPTQQSADDSQASVQSSPAPASQTAVPDSVMIADDADLIEKEWVMRAKAVVEQTKEDPFVQNKELNRVKADYIKKRYNKDVKVSE